MGSRDSPLLPSADGDTYLEIVGDGRLSITQERRISAQTAIDDGEFERHIRSVLRNLDPLGLRIILHVARRPKCTDRHVSRALRIPVEFARECHLRIVQKIMSPIVGAMVNRWGHIPARCTEPVREEEGGTLALRSDDNNFEPAALNALSAIQRLSSIAAVIDREIQRFAPIAEAVVGIQDIAWARKATVQELAREALLQEGVDEQVSTDVLVSKPVEEIEQLRPELLDRLRSRVDDLQKLRPSVVEQIIAELLASRGFHYVCWVGKNPRTSADIVAAKYVDDGRERVYFIEVKRWKQRVGVQVVDHVYGAMIAERPRMGWHAAMVVSTYGFASFRKYSRDYLRSLGVHLKDRDDLVRWLTEYRPNGSGLWLPPNT